ncbi:hypothetical protein [Chryseobacterium aurantiacum]|uniref:hypothetical protein n=1 Tax=Chryseobacterium aurantiacum TaxID=2116499 RepID=UPI0013C50127|nr:hypothetical protein [Chryseobacterium aurantiacum]
MKRKIITLGTILFLSTMVQAQYIPKIIPPSPNATSIAKFVESPVSYYRGSANVSIPLFNIDSGDLPLNVSIQYDTKGIPIGEVASSIGTGWSLSAGGLITRQVRQRPDENKHGYLTYSYNATYQSDADLRNELGVENASFSDSDQPVDEDPDLFFINFLGKSGKFIIDNVSPKKAVVQGFDDWKVDIDYVDINSSQFEINRIVITDELGNKYYFGQDYSGVNSAYDIVNSISSGILEASTKQLEDSYKTAWHLKEVRTAKNSYLFNYAQEIVHSFSKEDLKGNVSGYINPISMTRTVTKQQVLKNISFPEGTLDFIYGTADREDLRGGKALNTIILKDTKPNQIRKISLVQGYRTGDGNHTNIHPKLLSTDLKSDKRLFLNQINEMDKDDIVISSHKFEYNPKELPNRYSNSIDHWGYFNGKPNSMNIFQTVADRNIYAEYAEAGILTKITYPTGGTESFFYEDNNVIIPTHLFNAIYPVLPSVNIVGGGRRISSIETNDNNGKITKRKFTYTLPNGTTSGKLLGIPDYMSVIKRYGNIPIVMGQLSRTAQPMSSFNNAGQVGYSMVKESFLSADNSVLWSKTYTFTNYLDGGEYYRYPYHLPDDMSWARGLTLGVTSSDSSGKTVELLQNQYSFSGEEIYPYRFYEKYDGTVISNVYKYGPLPGMPPSQAEPNYLLSHNVKSIPMYKPGRYWDSLTIPTDDLDNYNIYRTAFFYGGVIKNYQKIKTEYENGIPVKTTTTDIVNESLNHHKVTSEKTTYSDGTSQENSYQYAHEKGNVKLINANMVGVPLETKVIKRQNSNDMSGKIISRVETRYDYPLKLFPISVSSYDLQSPNTKNLEIFYDLYDPNGNLLQYTTKGEISTVIIWGYGKTKPIAKIENAKLEDIPDSLISAIVTASDTDGQDVPGNNETAFLAALDTFRNSLPNYQVTTYSYDPLIGVRSITQPSGIREVYLYDNARRLMEIREDNQSGKLLKEFNYKYKN